MTGLRVVKASGDREPFSAEKLRRSLRRSGASEALVRATEESVLERLEGEVTTRELYRVARRELERRSRPVATRYGLRRALMALGPSGFPFERLVAALLTREGFRTELDITLPGRCVSHEVDVVATREGEQVLVECKYHNAPGHRTDVRVALYVRARALDIAEAAGARATGAGATGASATGASATGASATGVGAGAVGAGAAAAEAAGEGLAGNGGSAPAARFMLVTNTKFTADAIRYGTCAGLELLGWDHPLDGSLARRLEHGPLMPVTCLRSLSRAQQRTLLDAGVVTVTDLAARPELREDLAAGRRGLAALDAELDELMHLGPGSE